MYYAGVQVAANPNWKQHLLDKNNVSEGGNPFIDDEDGLPEDVLCDNGRSPLERDMSPYLIPEICSFMFHEPLCIWTLINMAYCILISLGTAIQHLVFGELRVSEQQHIKDKFWNFVFYKFIFVFGVLNVQAMDEVVLWCSWFTVLGFMHLLAQLCKDRFEYLSFSPTTPRRTHLRLLGLLSIILTMALFCLLICVLVGCHSGINTFAFMVAECILLIVRTLYVITRYSIYLWDISHEGLWEKRGRYVYITELVFELSELVIDMVHHIHMLVWGNMFLTMASLVICMQLRLLFYQLQHKVKSHRNYLRVLKLVNMFPEVSGSAIESEEKCCAICWELVSVGRRLPCGHLFHGSCLHAWLHQDLTCPTCRHKLQQPQKSLESNSLFDGLLSNESESSGEERRGVSPSPGAPEGSPASAGWRYVSWLPSFSVEQSHTQLPRHQQHNNTQPASTSQLDNLARKVQQMFPDVSYSVILEDLRHTHSVEETVDNILEARILTQPPMFDSSQSSSSYYKNDLEEERRSTSNVSSFDEKNASHQDSKMSSLLPDSKDQSDSDSDSLISGNMGAGGGFGVGGRFSKSAEEREVMLEERKNSLLSAARRRFVARKPGNTQGRTDDTNNIS